MAISPPSDIVLDALRAGDPAIQTARSEQLAGLARTRRVQAAGPQPARMPFDAAAAQVARRNQQVIHPTAAPVQQPFRQFEAAVLQNFVTTMLPSEDSAAFGKGTAGSVSRSWMAEAIAGQIAEAGGIGLADKLSASYAGRQGVAGEIAGTTADVQELAPAASSETGFFTFLQELWLDLFGGNTPPRPADPSEWSTR